MGTAWIIFLALGTIALAAVLFTSMVRNRRHDSPAEVARTERATHQLYEREDAAEHAREDQVER